MVSGNAGVIYGNRGEVYEGSCGKSLSEFISSTFNIKDVFDKKLVMGRCICNGKKALETDVVFDDEEAAEKFICSKESRKPHVILIYDKHNEATSKVRDNPVKEQERNVVIPEKQWDELVSSIKKLELYILEQEKPKIADDDVVHSYVVCDGCYPTEQEEAVEIRGPRFKCVACPNFDLCSKCESKGYENFYHKNNHNMIKMNVPSKRLCKVASSEEDLPTTQVSSNDKEVVIDIASDRKDLFEMFSKMENLEEIVHGFESYKKWTEKLSEGKIEELLMNTDNGSPAKENDSDEVEDGIKQSRVDIELRRKDKAIIFQMHNTGATVVPGGLTLVYSTFKKGDQLGLSNVTCELPMGPHKLSPGYTKMLKYNYFGVLSDISMENKSQIALVDGDNNTVFKGINSGGAGSHFILEHTGSLSDSIPNHLPVLNRSQSLQLLEKDDSDGVISSTVTNDDETLHSASDQETSNWEEYDFLSESDV